MVSATAKFGAFLETVERAVIVSSIISIEDAFRLLAVVVILMVEHHV